MIKIQKADLGGYGIDHIQKSVDLRAIALTEYRLVNDKVFDSGEPMLGTAVPVDLDIYSIKIDPCLPRGKKLFIKPPAN